MIEVHPGLYVGSDTDALATAVEPGWYVVHACKEPWHRAALGYASRGAPKEHAEFLFAHRPGALALNLIDAPSPDMIPQAVIAEALAAIGSALDDGCRVLVHCNRGESRGPTIAFLYLALRTDTFDACTYGEAVEQFRKTYPAFAPAAGMDGFARSVWNGDAGLPIGAMTPVFQEPRLDLPERDDVTNHSSQRNRTEDLSQPRALFSM